MQTVGYGGYRISVPASWPVYDLAKHPSVCVRFNRHAVYLGTPSATQRCPAHAAGRTEALLLEPLVGTSARAGGGPSPQPITLDGSVTAFTVASSSLRVVATWGRDGALVAHLLHRPIRSSRASTMPRAPVARVRPSRVRGRAAAAVYGGLGFDTCSAPSTGAMSAWSSSPYRAIGIYIGGVNSSCAQPNLTAGWVSTEVGAGWHLIPTYVGLQGPGACHGTCSTIDPNTAAAEGAAAANDAVAQAQALGIPAGNPIYYDMEQYSRPSGTSSVLAFLSAWTSQLHADGYTSGVYSSASSGITDLVNSVGTSVAEPDDIWIADWNGQQTTSDSYVPAGDWSNHQRIHQYQGGHYETYAGVTLDIDNDYLDGATANTSTGGGSALHSAVVLIPGGSGAGYSLDGFGGVHPFGGAPAVRASASWPGWDIARA
ncbi:MAG TPA: DUF1906 domain-containing protein, partial [Solirubrobacteraceae bacterium]|nr:DUF1906 domain-containing protein [Solirubrobacteraceae bacterium]